jgi:hypothetical protein
MFYDALLSFLSICKLYLVQVHFLSSLFHKYFTYLAISWACGEWFKTTFSFNSCKLFSSSFMLLQVTSYG